MNRMLRLRTAFRGFTLIELLVVILILGILAALIVPKVVNQSGKAKVAAAQSDLAAIKSALDAFHIDCDRYPTEDEGLNALVTAPSGLEGKWKQPYLTEVKPDPWGQPYVYKYPGNSGADSFTISSPQTADHPDITDGE